MAKIVCAFLACSSLTIAFSEGELISNQDGYVKFASRLQSGVNVWWLVPRDERWSTYTFTKVEGGTKDRILELFKSGKFSETGGQYYWLDMPHEGRKKIGEGVVVFEKDGVVIQGFGYTAIMVDRKGVGFLNVAEFNPSLAVMKCESACFLSGVILDANLRTILKRE